MLRVGFMALCLGCGGRKQYHLLHGSLHQSKRKQAFPERNPHTVNEMLCPGALTALVVATNQRLSALLHTHALAEGSLLSVEISHTSTLSQVTVLQSAGRKPRWLQSERTFSTSLV